MRPTVRARFRSFNEPFEGVVPYMYLDIKGLVTVGVGNLIDPVEAALALPFQWKNQPDRAATEQEIRDEWKRLKDDQSLAVKGYKACAALTNLELSDDSINSLIAQRLGANEAFLKRQPPFTQFDNWPADAQMGLLSMAWAMGPGGFRGFPRFSAACANSDFDTAAQQCAMSVVGNPGVAPRNRADIACLENAAAVLAGEPNGLYDRDTLYYPLILMKPPAPQAVPPGMEDDIEEE